MKDSKNRATLVKSPPPTFSPQALQPSMVIVGIYCSVIAALFLLLKTVNYRLHHALDEGEVVEHRAKQSLGSRGGTEGTNDGGVTRREDSNGPG